MSPPRSSVSSSTSLARTTRRRNGSNLRGSANRVIASTEDPGYSSMIPPARLRMARPFGVAQSYRLTMSRTYLSNLSLSSSFTEGTVYLNDPTNAQGFAKMSAFYSKALVVSARIVVKFAATGITQPWVLGLTITTNTTSLGTTSRAIDDGLSNYRVLTQAPISGVLTLGIDVRKFANVPSLLSNYDWYSLAGVSPTQQVVCHTWYQTLNGSAGSDLISTITAIEMDVIFTDPIPFT